MTNAQIIGAARAAETAGLVILATAIVSACAVASQGISKPGGFSAVDWGGVLSIIELGGATAVLTAVGNFFTAILGYLKAGGDPGAPPSKGP